MSFLNPLFLIATAAAVLPVLYHLVRRRRVQTVPFPSLMLLKGDEEQRIKRRRLQDWLLMLVRAALFGLLALAFARPFLPQERAALVPVSQREAVVLLIDRSFSMQYGDTFVRARQEALQQLDAAGPGDVFSVIAFSDDAQQLTDLSGDAALHRRVIEDELRPSYRPADVRQALQRARDVLLRADGSAQRKVVLISDFQRSGWTGVAEAETLPEGIAFEPVSVATENPSNAYVEAFNLGETRTGEEVALRYDARIRAQGPTSAASERAAQDRTVHLAVEGEPVLEQTLPGDATEPVTFEQTLSEAQTRQGQLSLAGSSGEADALPADDVFYFTYQIAPRPSILVVGDAPDDEQSGLFFLSRAFDVEENARYRFAAGGPSRLNRSLEDQDAVFLADVAALTEAQAQRLRQYVEAGGGLAVSLGASADAPALADAMRTLGVGRLEAPVTPSPDAVIGEVDAQHPVFSAFSSSEALWRPSFRRYVTVAPDTNAVVVGTYGTGDPFLLERALGQGTVLVYTSSFGTGWTDFPLRAAFVPFVYQLAGYVARRAEPQRLFVVGEAVSLRGAPGEAWEIRAPGGERFTVPVGEAGVGYFRDTEAPGHYLAANEDERFPFSVNIAPEASDVQFRDQEEVYAAVAGPAGRAAAAQGGETPEPPARLSAPDVEEQQQLWKYLLLLVLGLFALETVLANRRSGTTFGS